MSWIAVVLIGWLLLGAVDGYAACKQVHRSSAQRLRFMRQTGYPHGRSGYIVDHVIPLCLGGADSPQNMQWQTVADAKLKDKIEWKYCRLVCKGVQQ